MICARSIGQPRSNAIHRLGAPSSRTLLEAVCVRAGVSIAFRIHHDLVRSASPILVVRVVMRACTKCRPCTHTVHGLRAPALIPLSVHVRERAPVSIICRIDTDPVATKSSVLVQAVNLKPPILKHVLKIAVILKIDKRFLAWRERIPRTHAVHRLRTTPNGALLRLIRVRALVSVVRRGFCHKKLPAPPVLVRSRVVDACPIL